MKPSLFELLVIPFQLIAATTLCVATAKITRQRCTGNEAYRDLLPLLIITGVLGYASMSIYTRSFDDSLEVILRKIRNGSPRQQVEQSRVLVDLLFSMGPAAPMLGWVKSIGSRKGLCLLLAAIALFCGFCPHPCSLISWP